MLSAISQKPVFEIPSPIKSLTHLHSSCDFQRLGMIIERHEEYQELFQKCIKDDKHVATCIIYKCLIHCHTFEAERRDIFDYIIETINGFLKVDNEINIFPYWLSNASTVQCLLQRNLRSNGFLPISPRHARGLNSRMDQD